MLRSIARRVRDEATAEDLTQDMLLRVVAAEIRREFTDCRHLEKFASALARNLVADEWRRIVRNPESSDALDECAEFTKDDWATALREHLVALRPQLDPHLGPVTRRVLSAYLDDGFARVVDIGKHLGVQAVSVRRALRRLRKRIAAITPP